MQQFLMGLGAGLAIGLVIEWLVDWRAWFGPKRPVTRPTQRKR